MLISIIIPVYNCDKYLSRCLESVINQTYENLEIILVNDGSTDNSGFICDQYAKKDKRIIVYHKKNNGVSSARNVGLKNASGMYIGFIDSDDYVETNMIEKLVNMISIYHSDILIFGYRKEDRNGKLKNSNRLNSQISILTPHETLNRILDKNEFQGYVCNKLFSSDLLKKNGEILFDEAVHVCEDLLFCCECILKSQEILYDTTPLYHYVFHGNNTTAKFNMRKLTALKAYENILKLIMSNDQINISAYKNSYMQLNISLLLQSQKEKNNKTETYTELRSNLYQYKISELTQRNVRIACLIARFNTNLLYFLKRLNDGLSYTRNKFQKF